MKETLLALILFFVSASASAEWTRANIEVKGLRIYVDFSTIYHTDIGTVKMWDLTDYEKEVDSRETRYSSVKTLREYDCKGKRYRDSTWSWHTKNMGEGIVVFSYLNNGTPRDWTVLDPGDIDYYLMGIACQKRGLLSLLKSPEYNLLSQW